MLAPEGGRARARQTCAGCAGERGSRIDRSLRDRLDHRVIDRQHCRSIGRDRPHEPMDPEAVERSVRSAGPATAGTSRHRRRCARGAVFRSAPAQIGSDRYLGSTCTALKHLLEGHTPLASTRPTKARYVPIQDCTYRYRTAMRCVARCGDKRPHEKGLSL